TVAKIPARRGEAINQLKRINADAPGNTGLQNNLALLLFSSDRRDEGFAVLEQMAKSNAGREGASKIWYGQIKDMPVSDASVSPLNLAHERGKQGRPAVFAVLPVAIV
ncbi:hypothetical protein ACUOA5_50220, partial [Escherichia coli]